MVPVSYSYRSLAVRWKTTLMTASGFTLVVAALVVMLAFINGIQTICALSGEAENIIVLNKGSNDEVLSNMPRDLVAKVENTPGVARDYSGQPIASRELFLSVNYFTGDAADYTTLEIRGVLPVAYKTHTQVRIVEGEEFRPGQSEVIVGRSVQREHGFELGDKIEFGGRKEWKVVGIFEANGSAFESEIWCDLTEIASQRRREGVYSTVVLRAPTAELAKEIAEQLNESRVVSVDAVTEVDYYAKQGEQTAVLQTAAWGIAGFMAVGAVFGVMNTMFAAIGQRIKDIAVLRIMGFMPYEILISFMLEALFIAMIGGSLGALLGYATNGLTQNASIGAHTVEFAFKVDSQILAGAAIFSLIMGVMGGLIPAMSAMRVRPLEALR